MAVVVPKCYGEGPKSIASAGVSPGPFAPTTRGLLCWHWRLQPRNWDPLWGGPVGPQGALGMTLKFLWAVIQWVPDSFADEHRPAQPGFQKSFLSQGCLPLWDLQNSLLSWICTYVDIQNVSVVIILFNLNMWHVLIGSLSIFKTHLSHLNFMIIPERCFYAHCTGEESEA